MRTIKTSGITINRWNYSEADRILMILTPKHGKISAIARGARKISSRLGSNLELFYLVNWILVEAHIWYVITGAEVQNHYRQISNDLAKTRQVGYLCYLVNTFILEGGNYEPIYYLLKKTIEFIGSNRLSVLTIRQFEWQLLVLLGHKVELYQCIKCRTKPVGTILKFSILGGGIVCRDCGKKNRDHISISANAIKVLRLFVTAKSILANSLPSNSELEQELLTINRSFIEMILEKPLPLRFNQLASSQVLIK